MSAVVGEPLWSDLQLSWLQAMGHTVYLERTALSAASMLDVAPAGEIEADRGRRSSAPAAPAARRVAPQVPTTVAVEPRPSAAVPRRTRVGLPDRLQIALLRASGCDPRDPQTQQLMASWPLETLRTDPAAKRALWPQLRALRRRALP